ncbi:MAG TPA: hypothetical protein VF796_07525 [Humisphaera sp.]
MRGLRAFTLAAVVGLVGFSASSAEAALAKAAGGSGYSGTLSSNKAIRKQQLIADPNSPTGGTTSTLYNPAIVSLSGFSFGPGYTGSGLIQIDGGEGVFLTDLAGWLADPFGAQTGYVQIQYSEGPIITAGPTAGPLHGQITPPAGYLQVDRGGPKAVDTHALFFDYLPNVPDRAVAEYTVYADPGQHGNRPDFMNGQDDQGKPFTLGPGDIAPVTVRGSLDAVPLPPAVFVGGLLMGGIAVARRARKASAAV